MLIQCSQVLIPPFCWNSIRNIWFIENIILITKYSNPSFHSVRFVLINCPVLFTICVYNLLHASLTVIQNPLYSVSVILTASCCETCLSSLMMKSPFLDCPSGTHLQIKIDYTHLRNSVKLCKYGIINYYYISCEK